MHIDEGEVPTVLIMDNIKLSVTSQAEICAK